MTDQTSQISAAQGAPTISRRTVLRAAAWTAPAVLVAAATPALAASGALPGLRLLNTVTEAGDYVPGNPAESIGGAEGRPGYHNEGFEYRFRVENNGEAGSVLRGPVHISFYVPEQAQYWIQDGGGEEWNDNYRNQLNSASPLFSSPGITDSRTSYMAHQNNSNQLGATYSAAAEAVANPYPYTGAGNPPTNPNAGTVRRVTLSVPLPEAGLEVGQWVQVTARWVIPPRLRRPNNNTSDLWIQPEGARSFTWFSDVVVTSTGAGEDELTSSLEATASAGRPDGLWYFDGGPAWDFGHAL